MQTRGKNNMHLTGKKPRPRTSASTAPAREPDVQVQFTPAKPFNRNSFLLHMATVVAVVLAVVLGMSVFFKAETVTVSGAVKYTPWEIKEASGIQDGDGLLGLSRAKISARVRAKLPYVANVRVGIKLPDTVNIEITERTVVYSVEDTNAAWWLLDADGRIVDSTNAAAAKDHTRILNVQIQNAVIGEQAVAAEPVPEGTGETGATLPLISPRDQLAAALQVIAALENNGVMGTVDTIDVQDLGAMTLAYQDRYRVTLGDTARIDYKIGAMKAAIEKMGQYQSGYLDVSFTIWPNEVGYRPFEESSGTKN